VQKKLDLECVLEEEQLRNKEMRMELEKEKALLQTKLKQLQEHSQWKQTDRTRIYLLILIIMIIRGGCLA